MIEYNVYCDESCHLEHDKSNVMVLGAVYCSKSKVPEINRRIKEIKAKYGVQSQSELKWTKIGIQKQSVYNEIVDYFFDDDDLHFRCVVADKTKLNHKRHNQTHDEWYYKMYFLMLNTLFDPANNYNVYIDIKDDYSYEKAQKLREVCCNKKYDFSGKIIKKVQPIRSNEIQIMQLTDILIGALGYRNRNFAADHKYNQTKLNIINRIRNRSGYLLTKSTLYKESKFNILIWESQEDE